MTPKQAIKRIEQLKGEIHRALFKAVQKSLTGGKTEARRMSSGKETPATLRKKDHPYARRHGVPILPPEIINKQRGVFFEAWRTESAFTPNGEIGGKLINDSDVADFLNDGTSTMFRRPIKDFIEDFVEQTAYNEAESSIQKLEEKYG